MPIKTRPQKKKNKKKDRKVSLYPISMEKALAGAMKVEVKKFKKVK